MKLIPECVFSDLWLLCIIQASTRLYTVLCSSSMCVSCWVIFPLMKGRNYLILLVKLSSWQHYMLKVMNLTWQVTFTQVSDLWLLFVLWSISICYFIFSRLACINSSTYPFLSPFTLPPVLKCCLFSFLLHSFSWSTTLSHCKFTQDGIHPSRTGKKHPSIIAYTWYILNEGINKRLYFKVLRRKVPKSI